MSNLYVPSHSNTKTCSPTYIGRLLDSERKLPFARLAATIRIAHKYQADRLLALALTRLRRFFTPLDALVDCPTPHPWPDLWAQLEARAGLSVPMSGATGIEAVNLARLLWDAYAVDLLPFALLLCCTDAPALPRAPAVPVWTGGRRRTSFRCVRVPRRPRKDSHDKRQHLIAHPYS